MKREIPWNLIVSKLKQESTAQEEQQLELWLSESGNQEVFDELQILWSKIQQNAANYTPDADFYWKELSRRMKQSQNPSDTISKQQSETKKRKVLLRPWVYVAAACAVVVLGFSFYLGQLVGRPDAIPLVYTSTGGKATASLPDKTSVWMHANTRIVYDMQYEKDEREVTLRGEAYFDVAHDKHKPFIVQTDGLRIVVHGTKFNVEAFPDAENTYVSLIEGSVSLETMAENCLLKPGETATYNRNNHRLSIEKDDVLFASSWTKDQIEFNQRSLRYICRFLTKWYHVKIQLDTAIADKFHYTFTLSHNEPLEEILRLMARINPMEYTFNENNEVFIFNKIRNKIN